MPYQYIHFNCASALLVKYNNAYSFKPSQYNTKYAI